MDLDQNIMMSPCDSNFHIKKIHKIIKQNPIDDEDDVFQLVKQINNYISKNPDMNSIDSKDLNAEINIKGYAFSKNHGDLKLIKKYYTPMCRSKTKPIEDKIGMIEVMLDQLKKETSDYIKQMEIRINTIDQCLKTIQEDSSKHDVILSKVVKFINDNFDPNQQQSQPQHQSTYDQRSYQQNHNVSPLDLLRNKF